MVLRSFSAGILALLFAGAAFAADDSAKSYSIDTSGTTREIKAGANGVFKLKIACAKGYHISPEAPLKIAMSSDQLKLAKDKLTFADAEDKKQEAPVFSVGFSGSSKGVINADAVFFVCSEQACERKTEKITVAVDVKP